MKNSTYSYMLVLSMFLWGGGWSALKILTPEMSAEVIIFWRFFFMSLAFLPILYFLKKPIVINKPVLKYVVGSSFFNISFMVFSFLGIKYGYAGSGGVIITILSPLMTFLLVAILFRTRVANVQYFGLAIGLFGGAIMLRLNNIELFLNTSSLYFLLSALVWAALTILSQHSQKHIHPIHYSFLISVVSTIVVFAYSFGSDLLVVFHQGALFWAALLYLAILGQTLATTIFFMASGKLGSEITSSFMFLVPVFALFIAWLVLDEPLQLHIVIGGIISTIAILFINKKPIP